MTIGTGDALPDAKLLKMGAQGPEIVDLNALCAGKRFAIFALPGAFSSTCSSAHVPSFIRTIDQFKAKGIDEIFCISVNDVFVMKEWGIQTGASEAGIHMLADGDGSFTKAMGRDFSALPLGFVNRSKRYAMLVEDGKITTLHEETRTGICDLTGGEALLEAV